MRSGCWRELTPVAGSKQVRYSRMGAPLGNRLASLSQARRSGLSRILLVKDVLAAYEDTQITRGISTPYSGVLSILLIH